MDKTDFSLSSKVQKILAAKTAENYIALLIIYKEVYAISGLLNRASANTVMSFTDTRYIILLYALPLHTMHILQPSEILFAKLKKKYSKDCNMLYSNNNELVTKYSFAKIFGPAFIITYTFMAIINFFKATEIWFFNPNAISNDCLDPSLVTERFNLSSSLPLSLVELQLTSNYSTRSNVIKELKLLKIKNETFRRENLQLKKQNASIKENFLLVQEELEIFKNPGTFSLKLVLKYSVSKTKEQE
ncbi:13602_t:CDS:2, partial [Cetraspora pellucida]